MSPNFPASQRVVVAWIRMVRRIARKVTEAIISAPGTFIPRRMPASAPGITPVSRVQHMKRSSRRLHFARRSGKAQRKTVIGRAMKMKTRTRRMPLPRYRPTRRKLTWLPRRMKINIRMIRAVEPTKSDRKSVV